MRKLPPNPLAPGVAILLIMTVNATTLISKEPALQWKTLPPLPDPIGFAGAFTGVSGGALIVAGGANFPGKMPWEGGEKIWHDSAFVLESPEGPWQSGFKLPMPAAYGVSITSPDGVVCIGGSDSHKHLTNVFLLQWQDGRLLHKELPALPFPLANSCGALVGTSIYLAGGIEAPDASRALKRFLRLDLAHPGKGWQELEPWPGPARMLSIAASVDGSFFLAGGTDLCPDAQGKPVRTLLQDAYEYTPGKGWKRVADLPNPVVAAPTPAPTVGKSGFLLIGGDDGSLMNFEPKSKHPGFPKRVLHFDVRGNTWRILDEAPASRATLPATLWRGRFILPSGEVRPGVRSPEVWTVRTR